MKIMGTIMLSITLFNYFIDPLNFFGNNKLGVYTPDERKVKPGYLLKFPHDALLVGNSRMGMVPVARLEGGFHFFNASLGGAKPDEMYHLIDHYARDLKLVVIGIDLGAADPATDAGDLFLPDPFPLNITNGLNYLLSLKTIEFSCYVLQGKILGHPPSLGSDGTFETTKWREQRNRNDPARLEWELKKMKGYCDSYSRKESSGMEFFKKISACLKQRNIPCVVLIPPIHEDVASYIHASTLNGKYKVWREELASIFPNIVDLSFSPYNVRQNYFKTDPAHFTPEAAERMFNAEIMPVATKVSSPK